jgi:hypothetical protein
MPIEGSTIGSKARCLIIGILRNFAPASGKSEIGGQPKARWRVPAVKLLLPERYTTVNDL